MFQGSVSAVIKRNLQSYILIIALMVIWVGFGISAPNYWSADHIQNILSQMAIIAIMACGMVFVIVTGGIDLSVGFGAGFVSVVAAALFYFNVITPPLHNLFPFLDAKSLELISAIIIIIIGIGVGALIGVFQGSIIAYLAVPPFIVTLGGMFIFKSGVLLVTQGKSLFISGNDTFKSIAQGFVPPVISYILSALICISLFVAVYFGRAQKKKYGIQLQPLIFDIAKACFFSILIIAYTLLVSRTFESGTANSNISGIPILVVTMGIIAVLMSYISSNTRFGRYSYAIGGNREAARLSGINISKSIFAIYVTMGTLMGVSGVSLAAYVGSGTTAAGGGYELDVIASCILGGTSTLGGQGTVFGAIIGALIMQSLSNGLQMLNVNSNFQPLIKGLVLILAVWADINLKKKKS